MTKAAIRASLEVNESLAVIPGIFDIARVQNTGAAFGLLPGRRPFFIAISLLMIAFVLVYWWRERPTKWPVVVALGLVIGGALGNLIDRAFVGRVTDFLAFRFFSPVFNIADSAIVVGVSVLVVWILFGHNEQDPGTESATLTLDEEIHCAAVAGSESPEDATGEGAR